MTRHLYRSRQRATIPNNNRNRRRQINERNMARVIRSNQEITRDNSTTRNNKEPSHRKLWEIENNIARILRSRNIQRRKRS